jgi:hypothetical protein
MLAFKQHFSIASRYRYATAFRRAKLLSMLNFVTFDDGLSYVSLSEIKSFGHEPGGDNKGGTWIMLRDGQTHRTQWSVEKVAEKLGPVANLHY